MIFRKYSFHKLIQISQGRNLPDATASNTWISFKRYMYFFNLPQETFWREKRLSTHWNIEIVGNIPFKQWRNIHRETMCWMILLLRQLVFFERFIYFFILAEEAYLEQNMPSSSLRTMICKKCSFQQVTQFSWGINVLQLHFLTGNVFFGEVHVFLQLSWIGLCWAIRPYHHLETPKLQEEFLSKINSIPTVVQCAGGYCF
jgi:hypothetical protein